MLIAQVSDLHLHADPAHVNHRRFARTLDHLRTIDPLPELLILSGDLADDGDEAAYRHLRDVLDGWPRPVHLMLGNHDRRQALAAVFPGVPEESGFTQYAIEQEPIRLILLDTTEEGRAGGAFCAARAAWLRAELARAGDAPVVIFMHHPPAPLGLPWVDPGEGQGWVERFRAALDGHEVTAICAGHVHASAVRQWHGITLAACPSTSSDLSLMFGDMDPTRPDARPLVERSAPAFALHRWADGTLTTFFGRCPDQVIARWDGESRQVVSSMLAERHD